MAKFKEKFRVFFLYCLMDITIFINFYLFKHLYNYFIINNTLKMFWDSLKYTFFQIWSFYATIRSNVYIYIYMRTQHIHLLSYNRMRFVILRIYVSNCYYKKIVQKYTYNCRIDYGLCSIVIFFHIFILIWVISI